MSQPSPALPEAAESASLHISDPQNPQTSALAVASLLLGLASLLLLFITGIPAMWIGLNALRAVNASDGRLRGRRLAVAGLVLGGFGCAAAAIGLAVVVFVTMRVRSQRLECVNNLRRIGGAVLNYDAVNNTFPPATLPNAELSPDRRLSWLAALPPHLEQKTRDSLKMQSLYDQLDPDLAWDAGPNAAVAHAVAPLFLCPAHTGEDASLTHGRTDYVGLAGVGRNAAELPRDDPLAGIFGYDRAVRRAELTRGARETLLIAETTRDNGPWTAGGPPTVRGVDPADAPPIGPGRAFGGMHPDGQNVLFADGSAEFMQGDLAPRFFETLTRLRRDAGPTEP